MTSDKEIEARRLARKHAYRLTLTGDAVKLMTTLQVQSPEAWQSYKQTVEDEGTIEHQTFDTIYRTLLLLFPGRDAEQISDLLRRMLDIVREPT